MRKRLFVALAFLTLAGFGFQTASAQLPGGLPRIPRPGKPKATPTPAQSAPPATTVQPQPSASSTASQPQSPAGPGGIAVVKHLVEFTTRHVTSYKGDSKTWSWTPVISFDTTGPIPSGASYYAVVMQPNGAPWAELDCKWEGKDYECGGPNYPEDRATTASGVFPFSIKMRNPLAGTADVTLFSGKVKIDTAPAFDVGTPAERAKKPVYFTNQEWAMPIGYVFHDPGRDYLYIAFWVRGGIGGIDPHVFYRGQEIGVSSCDSRVEIRPSTSTAESVKLKPEWQLIECHFVDTIKLRDEGKYSKSDPPHYLSANPGEYEVKVLRRNKLSRSIKFTVGPDGKFTGGIPLLYRVESNAHNEAHGVIVPVAILDDQDGPWDKNAWRTGAFYGNPPAGFSPPQ